MLLENRCSAHTEYMFQELAFPEDFFFFGAKDAKRRAVGQKRRRPTSSSPASSGTHARSASHGRGLLIGDYDARADDKRVAPRIEADHLRGRRRR